MATVTGALEDAGNVMLGKAIAQIGDGEIEWIGDQAIDVNAVRESVERVWDGAVVPVVWTDGNVSEEGGGQRGKLRLTIQGRCGQDWHACDDRCLSFTNKSGANGGARE